MNFAYRNDTISQRESRKNKLIVNSSMIYSKSVGGKSIEITEKKYFFVIPILYIYSE